MKKRIVVIGGGFAGINLIKNLYALRDVEIILIDKNNYHYFPPLIYQVASSFIEPSNISYPFRKMLQGKDNVRFYQGEFKQVDVEQNIVYTSAGNLHYDYLVFAQGTQTNYFGINSISEKALPLKNITDALRVRNSILCKLEQACKTKDAEDRSMLLTFVIAGGGPTGVELSGMLSEMNKHIRLKDYPELKAFPMQIFLIDAADSLLGTMSKKSQAEALKALAKMGVQVKLSVAVKDYHSDVVFLSNDEQIKAKTLIWVSGVIANTINGLPQTSILKNRRVAVNNYNLVAGTSNVFAIGDICCQSTDKKFPQGHPQVAQVAIQQGTLLGKNFKNILKSKPQASFSYFNKGQMAIINKYKAVAELPIGFFKGFIAWCMWLIIHILPIAGFKNKLKLCYNWLGNFLSNDPTLRLIIEPGQQPEEKN